MVRRLPGPPLPALLQAGLIWCNPVHFGRFCHWRYGDLFTVRIPGIGTLGYLADPADITSVTCGDPAVFHAGEAAAQLCQIVGTRSLLMLDEDKHRRSRSLLRKACECARWSSSSVTH